MDSSHIIYIAVINSINPICANWVPISIFTFSRWWQSVTPLWPFTLSSVLSPVPKTYPHSLMGLATKQGLSHCSKHKTAQRQLLCFIGLCIYLSIFQFYSIYYNCSWIYNKRWMGRGGQYRRCQSRFGTSLLHKDSLWQYFKEIIAEKSWVSR